MVTDNCISNNNNCSNSNIFPKGLDIRRQVKNLKKATKLLSL